METIHVTPSPEQPLCDLIYAHLLLMNSTSKTFNRRVERFHAAIDALVANLHVWRTMFPPERRHPLYEPATRAANAAIRTCLNPTHDGYLDLEDLNQAIHDAAKALEQHTRTSNQT